MMKACVNFHDFNTGDEPSNREFYVDSNICDKCYKYVKSKKGFFRYFAFSSQIFEASVPYRVNDIPFRISFNYTKNKIVVARVTYSSVDSKSLVEFEMEKFGEDNLLDQIMDRYKICLTFR